MKDHVLDGYANFAEFKRKDPEGYIKYLNEKHREADMALNSAPGHAGDGAAAPVEKERKERKESKAKSDLPPLFPSRLYELLPATLRAVTDAFEQEREQAVFVAGALPVLAGAAPNVLLRYGRQWQAPNLYVLTVAPAGSGKGALRHAQRMGEPVHDRMVKASEEALNAWKERREDDDAETGPRPPFRSFYLAGDASAAGLKEDLSANEHGVIFETEILTLTTALEQEWGQFRDVLLKGAHNEPLTIKRKASEPLHIKRPAPSLALSGTPRSFEGIITDAEDGLFSRCLFLTFRGDDDFRNMFSDDSDDALDAALSSAGERLNDLRAELERRAEPLYVKIGENEQRRIVEAGKIATEQVKQSNIGKHFLSNVKRGALSAFRVAALLALLRLTEQGKPLDTVHTVEVSAADVEAGLLVAWTCLEHAAHLSERLRGANRMAGLNAQQRAFFEALPGGTFSTGYAKDLSADFDFTEKTARNYLKRFAENGLLTDSAHGEWEKPVFASLSFRSFLSFCGD